MGLDGSGSEYQIGHVRRGEVVFLGAMHCRRRAEGAMANVMHGYSGTAETYHEQCTFSWSIRFPLFVVRPFEAGFDDRHDGLPDLVQMLVSLEVHEAAPKMQDDVYPQDCKTTTH